MDCAAMPASQVKPGLIRRMVDIAFNQGNLAIVEELLAPNSLTYLPAWDLPPNRLGFKHWIAGLRAAFPDLSCTVEDEIQQGDRSAAHCEMRGTHNGPLFGNPPTARRIEVQGIIFARSENGQIVENWILVDQLGILQQLGIIPPPREVVT